MPSLTLSVILFKNMGRIQLVSNIIVRMIEREVLIERIRTTHFDFEECKFDISYDCKKWALEALNCYCVLKFSPLLVMRLRQDLSLLV